jgi:hypothetical protein
MGRPQRGEVKSTRRPGSLSASCSALYLLMTSLAIISSVSAQENAAGKLGDNCSFEEGGAFELQPNRPQVTAKFMANSGADAGAE